MHKKSRTKSRFFIWRILFQILYFICVMFSKRSSVMDITTHVMKIIIIWRWSIGDDGIPCLKRNTWNWCWYISLLISSIIIILLSYHRSDKFRSTLFLCFCIWVTYSRICPHWNPFSNAFCKNICDSCFFCRFSLFSFDNRWENKGFICFPTKRSIWCSDFFIEFREESVDDHVSVSCREYPICIWIEKSFEW